MDKAEYNLITHTQWAKKAPSSLYITHGLAGWLIYSFSMLCASYMEDNTFKSKYIAQSEQRSLVWIICFDYAIKYCWTLYSFHLIELHNWFWNANNSSDNGRRHACSFLYKPILTHQPCIRHARVDIHTPPNAQPCPIYPMGVMIRTIVLIKNNWVCFFCRQNGTRGLWNKKKCAYSAQFPLKSNILSA